MDISRLLQIICCTKAAHPEYFLCDQDVVRDRQDELLDEIEPDLMAWSEDLGLPYIRPVLSPESEELLMSSFARFIKMYVRELRATCRSGMNFVLL